jgi:16S rRNA (cytosine967-C5)-methyltransferase
VDLCAAPGGKTALLAHAGAHVIAVELSEKRATRIRENAARTKVQERVDVVVHDALTWSGAPADAVLLDAPCTGLGTTRRKPEIKLRRTPADVERDADLQAKLLAKALNLVKPGGVLVYSVCSPLPEEGRVQVERALAAHPKWGELEDVRLTLPWLPADAVDGGCVRLRPHAHDTDAFFCARLRRAV